MVSKNKLVLPIIIIDATLTLPLSVFASTEKQQEAYLSLWLYCNQEYPQILGQLIEYYLAAVEYAVDGSDLDPLWIEQIAKFDWDRSFSEAQKLKMIMLRKMTSADRLTSEIQKWFPDRKQTLRDTLSMIQYCTQFVKIASDRDKGDEDWDIMTATLTLMRHDHLNFQLQSRE
jgi:hypothetical protein